jgi:hypothetical protein
MFIKNTTPYIGKIKLVFERHPEYRNGQSKLNAIHLNLGLIKLVSRMYPNQTKDLGWEVNPDCIKLIEANTGLKVKTHVFGPNDEYSLPNSVHSPDGVYVGDIEQGWWYYLNDLRSTRNAHPHTAWSKTTKQWIGYSHRASCAFGKGDKLFDETWVPKDDELTQYEKYYVKYLDDYYDEVEAWAKSDSAHKAGEEEMTLNSWVTGYIPFKLRGSKTIHSYEDAYKAAVNFAKHVS